jgi:hypothetical protein
MKLFKWSDFLKKSNEDLDSICKKWDINNYTIKDGLVYVDGSVDLYAKKLTKLPLKFGEVSGNFTCSDNRLTSLEGAPTRVGGDFNCYGNQLTSLEGAPTRVGGGFLCSYNNLINLEGAPSRVGGYFECSYNNLINLEGAPEVVEKNFYCYNNKLTTLKGGSKVRGTTYLAFNNQLINFYGFPEDGWEGLVDFSRNPVGEILDLFPRERWCEAIDWIVEFDVLYSTVVPFMYLEAVFERMNLPVPEDNIYNLKNYEII